jgi:hypothetical protein
MQAGARPASRFRRYFRRLGRVALALGLLALVLYLVQAIFHPFDEAIARSLAYAEGLDANLSHEAFAGISMGSLVLILAICLFPFLLKKIDEAAYLRGLWRGLVSAAVFFLSTKLFALASGASRVYFLLAAFGIIVLTLIVVEGLSLAVREEDERSFRTDVAASIASGLLFGVLVKIVEFAAEWAKRSV